MTSRDPKKSTYDMFVVIINIIIAVLNTKLLCFSQTIAVSK